MSVRSNTDYVSVDSMSNQLTTLVPVFDGSNWLPFAEAIEAYLMAQGQWYTVSEDTPSVPATDADDADKSYYRQWKEDNLRAMGNIRLRCSPAIAQQIKGKTTAKEIYETLKSEFDKTGMASIFAEFKAALDISIPASQSPVLAIQKLNEHFERLKEYGVTLLDFIHGMLLVAKAPSYADLIVQTTSQMDDVKKIKPKKLGQMISNAWDQVQGRRKQNAPSASCISAIKQKKGEPNFQQQQQRPQGQQQQQNDEQKKVHRGSRGGRAHRHKNAHSHLASTAATVPRPSLESRLEGERPVMRNRSNYPRFKRALDLSKDLGIPASFEQVRALEDVVDAATDNKDDEPSESPAKRVKPIDWADDVDTISLRSDVDDDLLESIGYNEPNTGSRSVPYLSADQCTIADSACLGMLQWTRRERELMYLSTKRNKYCAHPLEWSACGRCKGNANKRTDAEWMLDPGASLHFTHMHSELESFQMLQQHIHAQTANGVAYITGKGDVTLRLSRVNGTRYEYKLRDVHYIPDLKVRLMSMGQLFVQEDMQVAGDADSISLHSRDGQKTLMFWPMHPGSTIYLLMSAPPLRAFDVTYDIAHRRFAHPGDKVLRRFKGHTQGAPDFELNPPKGPCPGCTQGKMPLRHFPTSERRASKPFELVHSDLKSFPVGSYYRQKYAIIFFDDFTSYAWIALLKQKSQAISTTRKFFALVKTQYNSKVIQWMSDAGGEYKSDAFDALLRERGIQILQSAPHTPQQNGRAERFMRTMMDKAEAMRFTACIPPSWWNFAIEHAVHIYNRTPMRRHKWRTPYEVLEGKQPNVECLRVFGCGAYVYIPADVRTNKLSPKSELMTYLGNTEHGWKFMRAPNNVIFTAAHAEFDEGIFPKCPDRTMWRERHKQAAPPLQPDDHTHSGPGVDDDEDSPARRRPSQPSQRRLDQHPDEGPAAPPARSPSPPPASSGGRNFPEAPEPQPGPSRPVRERRAPVRPGNVYGESRRPADIERNITSVRRWQRNIGIDSDAPSTRSRARQSRNEQAPVPSSSNSPAPSDTRTDSRAPEAERPADGPSDDSELAELCREGGVAFLHYLITKAIAPEQPKSNPREWTYRDILRLPKDEQQEWRRAALEELEALRKREVFELVDRPKGRKVIRNRWVFDVKTDGRKRARLVARGFSQVEGVDFDQIFSPVVRFETVHLALALAALESWYLFRLDVQNAYLYGVLQEEIYMEQPEGFAVKGQEHKVLHLLKVLYGLKQAGLVWWRTLDQSMKELGFTQLKSDAGVFIKHDGNNRIIVIVYVDDAIFAGSNKAKVLQAKERFMQKWECRDLGDVKEFLRMRVTRIGSKVELDQCAYLDKVLERCGMQNCKPARTPLPEGYFPAPYKGEVDAAHRTRFQTIIGSLLYLMLGTRPDIAFAVTKLAQHSANPSEEHLSRALYICRYLQGTRDYKLVYDGASGGGLIAFSDSDWGTDPYNQRRSQFGHLLQLAGGVFSWTSRAQKTPALSSKDAEYMALSDCSRQVMWVRSVLLELGYKLTPIPICCDNQGAIFTAENPVTEARTKHIDIRYHYIRDLIKRRCVKLLYLEGEENQADLLTKNLGHIKVNKFCAKIGLEFAA